MKKQEYDANDSEPAWNVGHRLCLSTGMDRIKVSET